MRRIRVLSAAFVLGALAAGCASEKSYVTTGDFPEAGRAIRKVGVVVAEAAYSTSRSVTSRPALRTSASSLR